MTFMIFQIDPRADAGVFLPALRHRFDFGNCRVAAQSPERFPSMSVL
jgi:hypothetical protein